MATTHDHDHRHNVSTGREPSALPVLSLQDEYRRAFSTRFRRLRGLVRTTVAENDALRVGARTNAEPVDAFRFSTDARKHEAFMAWFRGALDDEVLQPVGGRRVRNGEHYTGSYVRSAYRTGTRAAERRLRSHGLDVDEIDLTFNRPIHRETIRLLYQRNYRQLEGITDHADQELSRILTEGFAAGEGPRDIADTMTAELRDIQHTRARVMARTETLNAANQASLRRYQQAGVSRVEILPHDPCPICAPIVADGPYPIERVPQPPYHPNCVCSIQAVVG